MSNERVGDPSARSEPCCWFRCSTVGDGDESVSLSVEVTKAHEAKWTVKVLIDRGPNLPPVREDEVVVELRDSSGEPLPQTDDHPKFLHEAGGGLGATVNARRAFDGDAREVVVAYRNVRCSFGPLEGSE